MTGAASRPRPDRPAAHEAPDPAAPPIAVRRPRGDDPPLAVLVDFDGTIARTDVGDTILRAHGPADYLERDQLYIDGIVGSRTELSWIAPQLPGDPSELLKLAAGQPLDSSFAAFVRTAAELNVPVEVVSDGLGFYVGPALATLGVAGVPVISATTAFDGHSASIGFPFGNPDCHVCGTCKRLRVDAYRAAGRTVVFVGDGDSDRYAASRADLVFAKRRLAEVCRSEGWAFTEWHDFDELRAWLTAAVAAWRAEPASLAAQASRPFICGPEVWGPGAENPPARR